MYARLKRESRGPSTAVDEVSSSAQAACWGTSPRDKSDADARRSRVDTPPPSAQRRPHARDRPENFRLRPRFGGPGRRRSRRRSIDRLACLAAPRIAGGLQPRWMKCLPGEQAACWGTVRVIRMIRMPVDAASIPYRRLRSGALMPAIGLGTFGSDHVSAATRSPRRCKGAAAVGYRHFDCASVYGNEARDRRRAATRSCAAASGARSSGSPPSCGTTSTARTT